MHSRPRGQFLKFYGFALDRDDGFPPQTLSLTFSPQELQACPAIPYTAPPRGSVTSRGIAPSEATGAMPPMGAALARTGTAARECEGVWHPESE